MSLVRIALLTLQADLNWDARKAGQVRRAHRVPRLGVASTERQNLRLARREIDIERVGLDDGGKRGRSGHADERADIDLMAGGDAVEGCEDPGIAKVDVRSFDV